MPRVQAWPSQRSVNWKAASTCLRWAATLHNPRLATCHNIRCRRNTLLQLRHHFKRQCHQQPLPSSPHTNRGQHNYRSVGFGGPTREKGEKRGSITTTTANSGSRTLEKIPRWHTTRVARAATHLKQQQRWQTTGHQGQKPGQRQQIQPFGNKNK